MPKCAPRSSLYGLLATSARIPNVSVSCIVPCPARVPHINPERLVHLTLRAMGAEVPRRQRKCVGCCVRHREFYLLLKVGGTAGLLRIVEFWLALTGEKVKKIVL